MKILQEMSIATQVNKGIYQSTLELQRQWKMMTFHHNSFLGN
jgi:hypothetical protein